MVDAALANGAIFARDYRVLGPLRQGGMGSVYVALQLSTGKRRALKLMQRDLAARPDFRKRFELEARIGALIPSDHVVEVIGAGIEDDGRVPWLAMELLEGQDLATWLAARGAATVDETREIFAQLCHALGEAHARGIVHRDLKPENIFLATARRRDVPFTVKVLDFGIARIVAESQPMQTSTSLGTPLYMAPEQADSRGKLGPQTDIWPLGLIAFELLTGRRFWRTADDNILALAAETLMAPIPLASARAAELDAASRLPAGFDAWFAACVDRDPAARHGDASVAFAELTRVLGSRAALARTAPAVAPRVSVSPDTPAFAADPAHAALATRLADAPTPRRRFAVPAACAAFAMAAMIAAGVHALGGRGAAAVKASGDVASSTPLRGEAPVASATHAASPRRRPQTWHTGSAECDEYLRVNDCLRNDLDTRARAAQIEAMATTIKEQLRSSLTAPSQIKTCRDMAAIMRARVPGCAR